MLQDYNPKCDIFGALIGGAFGMGAAAYNNEMARQREAEARAENYRYGEMQAANADARTRALYNDLQSPGAIMQQLKDAGLSPSLMYGGGMGGSVGSGAQGAPAAVSPTTYGVSAMEAAQIGLIAAQTEKTKAETQNTQTDTRIKEIEETLKGLEAGEYRNTWEIMNSTWTFEGKQSSIFEIARDCLTYDQFMKKLRGSETDEIIKNALTTEKGQEAARSIFIAASQFHRDIMVLSEQAVNAKFQLDITEKLASSEFASLNADAAIRELRKNISTDELDTRQKNAWNNLLGRLEKTNPTMHDIVVVIGMIINNALTNYKMPTRITEHHDMYVQ